MSLDRTLRISTALVGVLIAAVLIVTTRLPRPAPSWVPVFVLLVAGASLVGSWAMAPCAIEIVQGELRVVRRAGGARAFPLDRIDHVEVLAELPRTAARLFGVGGFFGNYGAFWSRGLGRYQLYATRRRGPALLLHGRDGRKVLLTPDDPAQVRDALVRVGVRAAPPAPV